MNIIGGCMVCSSGTMSNECGDCHEVKKDHEIARFVNELTDIAKTFGNTQQLRERISHCTVKFIKGSK